MLLLFLLNFLVPQRAGGHVGAEHSERVVSFEARDVTIDEAVQRLCRTAGTNYLLALPPGMKGRVSLRVQRVPFEPALKELLEKSRAVCPLYSWRSEDIPCCPGYQCFAPNEHIWFIGPGESLRASKALLYSARVRSGPLGWLIKGIMAPAGINYTLSQEVGGKVSVSFSGLGFHDSLERIIGASRRAGRPLHVRIQDGLYVYTCGRSLRERRGLLR